MKEIKCIKTNGYKLTVDNVYEVIKFEDDYYFLINDNGKTVRYGKSLFEEVEDEVLVVAEPIKRTEQDMINSIVYTDDNITYRDLNDNEVVIDNVMDSTDTDISYGISQIYNIDNQIEEITDNLPEDDDYLNLRKALITAVIKGYAINDNSQAMWLMSTAIEDHTEEDLATFNELAGTVSQDKVNPNSQNVIRMWVFYTN